MDNNIADYSTNTNFLETVVINQNFTSRLLHIAPVILNLKKRTIVKLETTQTIGIQSSKELVVHQKYDQNLQIMKGMDEINIQVFTKL